MTSLLGHTFRKQALHRLYRLSGSGDLKKAPSVTRQKMNAALWGYYKMSYTPT